MSTKHQRVEACNELLEAISDCGRRFFYCERELNPPHAERRAYFRTYRGAVYFVDSYSGREIYTAWTRGSWRGFSQGGTLRDIVIKLSDFIRTGSTIAPSLLGPWPDWICGGDLWGYGADMVKVRRKAVELGIVAFAHEVHLLEYTAAEQAEKATA